MQIIKATALHRKSRGAQWRDDKGRGVAPRLELLVGWGEKHVTLLL